MINKVSEITVQHVAEYLRIAEIDATETIQLETFLNVAKDYVKNYTGLTNTEIDALPDVVIVVLILCQDMYDNRTMYVDKGSINKVVQTILDMHTINNL